MNPPIDISGFPTGGPEVEYDEAEQLEGLPVLQADALAYAQAFRSTPVVRDVVLAFGIAPMLGLFLVRFATPITRGELAGETEVWVVVGDLPFMCFETDDARSPARALELYCAIAQDWAEAVLSGRDLSESYPIAIEPTAEHAEMLLSRIDFIRDEFVPLA